MNLPEGYSLKHKSHFVFLYAGEEKIASFSLTGKTISEMGKIISKIEKVAWGHYDMKMLSVCQK